MDIAGTLALLGGLSPAAFMRRHWQKKPLLVRQAWPGVRPPVPRSDLFALAGRDDVESRLVELRGAAWHVRQGPLPRRALPPLARPGWTLLVQGLDLHVDAAHRMLRAFRFVPDARLDDLMVSWASPGGGVGPHVDSYDVFLLQLQGRRRWRVAPPVRRGEPAWVPDAPLKLLRDFAPVHDWTLEPGDLLYLPPRWGHEGTAVGGDCVTGSIGFRAPSAAELVRELLVRLADEADDGPAVLYRDPRQPATGTPAAIPPALVGFAREVLNQHLADPLALPRTLGALLTEPKPQVWFAGGPTDGPVRLDPRTRMMYDDDHIFINGEAFRAGGRDARLMRLLADQRRLDAEQRQRLGADAAALLDGWVAAGWVHGESA